MEKEEKSEFIVKKFLRIKKYILKAIDLEDCLPRERNLLQCRHVAVQCQISEFLKLVKSYFQT